MQEVVLGVGGGEQCKCRWHAVKPTHGAMSLLPSHLVVCYRDL